MGKIIVETKNDLVDIIENGVVDLSTVDVSRITDMSYLFYGVRSIVGSISNWDVSNVKDMSGMFECCEFSDDISNWDVSSVKKNDRNI